MRCMQKKMTPSSAPLAQAYQRLRRRLGQFGYISQGSVQDRTARQGGGAGYQWTRKVAGKTVTIALTAEQFASMKKAVSNYRQVRRQLKQMESLSRRIIFRTTPNPRRRKRLTQKVLGTN
jgi:virulence-associated protein VapD